MKKRTNYSSGKEDGKWVYWYDNGQKKEEKNYINGKKDGKWESWYNDGTKKEERYYNRYCP